MSDSRPQCADILHSIMQSDRPQDHTDDHCDHQIFDRALSEANELIRDHRNGFLPPRPGGPYRYRSTTSPSQSLPSEAQDQSREHDPLVDAESSTRGIPHDFETSMDRLSLGNRMIDSPALHRHLSPSKSSTYSLPLSTQNPLARPVRPSTQRIGGYVIDDLTSPVGNRKGHATSASGPKSERSNHISGPFDPATRAKYRGSAPASASNSQRRNPLSWVDIHKNPPSQSRDPSYTTNTTNTSRHMHLHDANISDSAHKKHGMEIRADYILEATRMRLKERSSKLPTPTAVSDDPGRPIVSFDSRWHYTGDQLMSDSLPAESARPWSGLAHKPLTDMQQTHDLSPIYQPHHVNTRDNILYVNHVPNTCQDVHDGQGIVTDENDDTRPRIRKSADGLAHHGVSRPLPHPTSTEGNDKRHAFDPRASYLDQVQSDLNDTSQARRSMHNSQRSSTFGLNDSTACHQCLRPISGRFVSLAGCAERFHPGCFACVICGTSLEALEIHPEPEVSRRERLDRIERRMAGQILDEIPGQTVTEDGDARLRFYCHLDWHELYAPRCKHCKTPILGEHIVALGAHWHVGHFFCAECGEPFANDATHIVRDGYAWCVPCQTKLTQRRAPKCKRCKDAVIGNYVVAMGGEWHHECLRCMDCEQTFDDGQIFQKTSTSGDLIVVCTRCRAMELKH